MKRQIPVIYNELQSCTEKSLLPRIQISAMGRPIKVPAHHVARKNSGKALGLQGWPVPYSSGSKHGLTAGSPLIRCPKASHAP